MENKALNSKILNRVQGKIALDNLETEVRRSRNMKKKILGMTCAFMLIIAGGAFTVNAATEGEFFETIKAYIIDENGQKTEIPCVVKKLGDEEVYQFEYEGETDDENTTTSVVATVSKDVADENGISTEININKNNGTSTIEFGDVSVNLTDVEGNKIGMEADGVATYEIKEEGKSAIIKQ